MNIFNSRGYILEWEVQFIFTKTITIDKTGSLTLTKIWMVFLIKLKNTLSIFIHPIQILRFSINPYHSYQFIRMFIISRMFDIKSQKHTSAFLVLFH